MIETQTRALTRTEEAPTKRTITSIQAQRLSALTGVAAARLEGKTVAEISKAHQWEIDQELFLFRKVCGRVVKKDPATGLEHPVPNATVHVYDTEDELWGYFPAGWPWAWLFPIEIKKEEIATTTTDACGRFCCWIPAFDIDWVVRWRLERVCVPDFLQRPTIADLLANLAEVNTIHRPVPPNPPDPGILLAVAASRTDVKAIIGDRSQQLLELQAEGGARFGAPTVALDRVLSSSAFASGTVPPPTPRQLKVSQAEGNGHAAALRDHPPIPTEKLQRLDLNRYIGPFLRCTEHFVPEWYPLVEAPDINFTVTQNIGGADVVVYDGNFEVPWGLGPVPDMTLGASAIAVASPAVECGPDLPCTGTPAIEMIGLVRATPAYIDPASGLSVRPEPPKNGGTSTGTPNYPATAPFCGELQFYGCVHIERARYYRVLAEFADSSGIPAPGGFTVIGPVVSHWPIFPPGAPTQTASCDANGWYPIQPDTVLPGHLLLDWYGLGNGVYRLTVEVGDAGKALISTSAPFVFAYDDSPPVAQFTSLGYSLGSAGGAVNSLGLACAQIHRHPGEDVYVHVSAVASSPHLRSVSLGASGCGAGPAIDATGTTDWWYQSPTDRSVAPSAIFHIHGDAPPGCYTVGLTAVSRAFSPAGSDGYYALDWWDDETSWRYTPTSVTVSLVDDA